MQMCIQLTHVRMHGKFVGVYETASTRRFLRGRTETCRSASLPAKHFANAWMTGEPAEKARALFVAACQHHIITISNAGKGEGVDRHMLGLRMCLKPGESQEFWEDALYKVSGTWVLSTSALFAGERIMCTGFGAAVEQGYGMNYMIAPKMVKVGIESKLSYAATSSRQYGETLQRTMLEVMALFRPHPGPESKL
jgi:carnitine O-acetyltransferase